MWREGYISDCYQGLSKDYTCLQQCSCYSGILARQRICTVLCPSRQTYGVSRTIAFSVAHVPVKMLYRLFLWMPILASDGFWSCLPKDASGSSSQTRPCSWKVMDCCLKTVVIANARNPWLLSAVSNSSLSAALHQIIGYVVLHEPCGMFS